MVVVWILLAALLVISLTTMLNTLSFRRLSRRVASQDIRAVAKKQRYSILIPARDEGAVIHKTVSAHLAQIGPDFEVLVLDDRSYDGTAERALAAGAGDPRLKVLSGKPLPAGWTGKNWACQQLANLAQGEVLVFTDADVRWELGALQSLAHLLEEQRADVLAIWPTQRAMSWSERLVVPLMMFAIMGYLPEIAVRYLPFQAFAAANGQCLVLRREAYQRIGEHRRVRSTVLEDVALARLAKRSGLRLAMALGDQLIWARMYHNWSEVRDGFAKNILAGHAGQPLFLLFSTLAHWALFIFPWVWLLVGFNGKWLLSWPEIPLLMIMLGLGARALSAIATRQRPVDAVWMPISVLFMTLIAAQALWWHYRYGGPYWKGRRIPASEPTGVDGSGAIDA